jgi:hypothetical protein
MMSMGGITAGKVGKFEEKTWRSEINKRYDK